MNPKHIQAQKDGKVPMEYLVTSVLADDARCHKHGADKYGVRNWREDPILASTYEGAMLRHFTAWCAGEDLDPDTGLSHLTHLRACCAVVLDAVLCGTLIDDRDRCVSIDKTLCELDDIEEEFDTPAHYPCRLKDPVIEAHLRVDSRPPLTAQEAEEG